MTKTNVIQNTRSTDVLQDSKHVLFVEGKDDQAFDPVILSELFSKEINVKALGSSPSIRSVAPALHASHPNYYFLIDRDFHFTDEEISERWENFPSEKTYNLLIWKRKEIESYFLNPEYLADSEYCKVSSGILEKKILQMAEQRLSLDAANYVIISVREEIKSSHIKKLCKGGKGDGFPDEASALQKLLTELKKYPIRYKEIADNYLSTQKIEKKFYETLKLMTGGSKKLKFGNGNWLQMIEGKEILIKIINSSDFKVQYKNKKQAQGKEKTLEVIKKLLRNNSLFQPEDFNALQTLIDRKIRDKRV